MRKEQKMAEFKVIMLGEGRVGKTSIIMRFTEDKFDPDQKQTSIGAEQAFAQKIIPLFNGSKIQMNLWDTAGQEIYSSIVSMYYKQARAAIVVFDLTDRNTIPKAHKWILELKNNTESKDCKIILVGNKQDKGNERQVQTAEGQKIAEDYGIKYYETSAKSRLNIKEIFQDLAEELYAENRNTTKRPTRIEVINDNFGKPVEEKDNKNKNKKLSDGKKENGKDSQSGGCC